METLHGDLFEYFDYGVHGVGVDAIAHVCNCQGVMGSGIAKTIKERYPQAFNEYRKHEETRGLTLGSVSVAKFNTHDGSKLVLNLHAQEFYGTDGKRYLDYEAMYECLIEARHWLNFYDIKSLGVPYNMGCDRAGGSWTIVEAMIKAVFAKSDILILAIKL